MNEPWTLVSPFAAGVLLGAIFFGGLWWTVRKGSACRYPALWFTGSFLLRTCIVLAGLYFASGGHFERILACLLGLVIARFIVTRLAAQPVEHHAFKAKETSRAP